MKRPVHMAHKLSDEWYEWICSSVSWQYGRFADIAEIDLRSTTDAEKVTCKHCLKALPNYLLRRITR